MVEALAFLVGRILVGIFFIFNGIGHFANYEQMTGYAESKGVKFAEILVPLTGILLIIGGLSIITGLFPKIGIIILLIFLVPTTIIMHNFWAVEDTRMKIIEMVNFMKNLALIGFLLMLLAMQTPWPYSLTF